MIVVVRLTTLYDGLSARPVWWSGCLSLQRHALRVDRQFESRTPGVCLYWARFLSRRLLARQQSRPVRKMTERFMRHKASKPGI